MNKVKLHDLWVHGVSGMGTYVSYTSPLCPADFQPGRFKSLWDLLKTEPWFTALEWLQCIQYLCSSAVVTMARHLSTISLGQPPPTQHRNVNGTVTGRSKASHGITHPFWLHYKLQTFTGQSVKNYRGTPLQQTNWESHSRVSVTNRYNT